MKIVNDSIKIIKKDLLTLSILTLLLINIGCSKNSDPMAGGPPEMPPSPVIVAATENVKFKDVLKSVGTAEARESVDISASVIEKITAIHFEGGETVEAGTLLVELENSVETATLKEAEVLFAQEEREFKRIKGLVEKQAASTAEQDIRQSRLDAAIARVAAAEAMLNDRNIKAPISGKLGIRKLSIGDLMTPGMILATLDDIDVVKVLFTIPEISYSKIKIGQSVFAKSTAYPDKVFQGRISAVDTRLDSVSRSVTVQALMPNEEQLLQPGMFLNVELISSERDVMAIPESSLIQRGELVMVVVIGAENTADMRPIKIGERFDGLVEVLDGLKLGEQVITEGTQKVYPGAKVHILNAPPPEQAQETP